MVDLIDLREVRRVRVGSKPFSVTVDSKGFVYVVESGDNQFSVFSADLNKIMSVQVGKNPIDIQLSLDNRFAYVTAEKDNRVLVYEVHD